MSHITAQKGHWSLGAPFLARPLREKWGFPIPSKEAMLAAAFPAAFARIGILKTI